MKKTKLLSVLLAALMMLSCFSAAFSVFAESSVDNVKSIIEKFNGDMTVAEPTEEDLKAYNEMTSAFNALSDDEINNFDIVAFDKLLHSVYNREIALYKVENNTTSNANAKKAAHERASKVIKMPAYVAEALNIGAAVYNVKTLDAANEVIALLKTASLNAVILAGGYNSTYKSFDYNFAEAYGGKLFDSLAEKISSYTQKIDAANKPAMPKYVSKPNASKFAEGENDPEYIAAFEKYLAYKDASADYNVAKYKFETEKHYLPALKSIVEAVPQFEYLYDFAVLAIEAKREHTANGSMVKINDFLEKYAALSESEKVWLNAVDNNLLAERTITAETELGIEYNYATYKLSNLIEFFDNLKYVSLVKDFEAVIASLSEPYNNETIRIAKEAYNKIPSTLTGTIDKDILAKYREILAVIQPDESVDNEIDLGAYKQTEVSFTNISEDNAEELANVVIDLVLKAAGVSDTKELISEKVLTNATIVSLAKFLYPALGKLTSLLSSNPAKLARNLTEEKFAGAAAALKAAGEDWDAVVVKSGDFGFEDGDAEGFLDAAAAMLRGASLIHTALKLENVKSTTAGSYKYGGYEDLIPILEILDLKAIKSSVEYTDYVNASTPSNDAKFRAILAPIVYLLVDFGNDPINTVCDVLPKAAYAIDSQIVNTGINKLLSKISLVKVDPVDLTTAGVYNILDDKLLTPKGLKLSEESFAALISELSGCGTAVVKSSVARGQNYRLGIESDRAKSIVVIMTWLLDSASNNKEFVNSLLDMLITDNDILKSALKLLIGASVTFVPKKLIWFLAIILIHVANIFTAVSKVFGK